MRPQNFEDRITTKFLAGDGCWEWQAGKGRDGYGRVLRYGRMVLAHRAVYELFLGPVDPNLDLHHVCQNKGCVRPAHLLPVTRKEHTTELTPTSLSYRSKNAQHCPYGHPYDEENTRILPSGARECRICRKTSNQKIHAQRSSDPVLRARHAAEERERGKDPEVRARKNAYNRMWATRKKARRLSD